MTAITTGPDRLFNLLPALYRIADVDQNHELQALLQLITAQADALHDDTQQLWNDFFIETCRPWVIPYIGDLVGNNMLHDLDTTAAAATAQSLFPDLAGPDLRPPGAIRLRADVAKTIHYRRRKGTPAMLEELARDVTGWGAHVVEFFTLLDWNQHLEHLRVESPGCPDLRQVDMCDRIGGPWDTSPHTVDVRRINEWDGWYNVPNVGFFLWRLRAYRLTNVTPRAIHGTNWRLTFSPLGQNIPLFSAGRREPGLSRLATELTVETPIRAAAFFEDLRTSIPAPPPPPPPTASTDYYGDPLQTCGSLVVFANDVAVLANDVTCMNLDAWDSFAQPAGTVIGIDVARGRLLIPQGRAGQNITVSYYYGFSAPMGGGEYSRTKWMIPAANPIVVSGGGTALDTAIATRPAVLRTVIQVIDDATYDMATDITLAANESLTVQAADETRPHLRIDGGSIAILTTGSGGSLTLNGLLVEGGLRIEGDLDRLRVLHTTLVPGRSVEEGASSPPTGPSLTVASSAGTSLINRRLEVELAFAITGALRIPSQVTRLWVLDSIVQGIEAAGGPAVPAVSDGDKSGPPAHIERSTFFGPSQFLKVDLASESIFTDQVTVGQTQQGCMRFSYVPLGSATPQMYRCQPALQTDVEAERFREWALRHGIMLTSNWRDAIAAEVAQWLIPTFESESYGQPDYAQLRRTCPVQVRTGAEDGSEMGVFCVLKQPQRASNLALRLDEYLPVGLEAGLIYVT
jgi:hypothetical protein